MKPNDKLVLQGIPPIPASIAQEVARYADFRGHGFVDWHPSAARDAGLAPQGRRQHRRSSTASPRRWASSSSSPIRRAGVAGELRTAGPATRSSSSAAPAATSLADLPPRPAEQTGDASLTEPDMRHDLAGWLHRQQPAARLARCRSIAPPPAAARRDRADAHAGRPGEPRWPAQARRASGRRLVSSAASRGTTAASLLTRYYSANQSEVWLLDLASRRAHPLLPAPGSTDKAVHLAGEWKRDNSRALLPQRPRRRVSRADVLDSLVDGRITPITRDIDGRHRRREPQPRRQAARRAGQGRRPRRTAPLRRRTPSTSCRRRALPEGSVGAARFHPRLPVLAFAARTAHRPRARSAAGARPTAARSPGPAPYAPAGRRHLALRGAADRPLEELRRPRDHRHRCVPAGALHRQAPGADRRSTAGPRRDAKFGFLGRAQLLRQRARHRRDPAERARLERLRQDLPLARRRHEARGLGQGHRRPARLDRHPAAARRRAASSSPAAATAAT